MLSGMGASTLTIIGTVIAVGLALAGLIMRSTARTDRRIDQVQAEGAADRRALQAAMDTFRAEMQRLAERQSHVEGRSPAPTDSPPVRG